MKGGREKISLAIVGTDSMIGREIKQVLNQKMFPLKKIDFYDTSVEEAFSKLTEFQGEPMVIHPVDEVMIGQADLVFLASDRRTNRRLGAMAAKKGYLAFDLMGTFEEDSQVPVIVGGINEKKILAANPSLVANPHPVSVILSHLFHALQEAFGIEKALSVVLQPASAFGESGIEELAKQSVDIMNGATPKKTVFKSQTAFNILPQVGRIDKNGHSAEERRIAGEVGRILGKKTVPFSLSIVQAPVFHCYSIMSHVELGRKPDIQQIEEHFKKAKPFKFLPPSSVSQASCASAAGKEDILISQIKMDESIPSGFWIWTVADNLSLGSAINAWRVACKFIPPRPVSL